jgi:hypothetical protein
MAYFNHAFKKAFLPATTGNALVLADSGTTADLTAGELGLFDAKTFQAITSVSSKPFILAQGSYFTNDKIGPFHGGYKESVKSKVINPKYINKVWTACGENPQNQIIDVSASGAECGMTYYLRMDLKGSPALRFLSHNIYRTVDAFTGCCTDDCSATCTGAIVDPTIVTIGWAKQILERPIIPDFVKLAVTDYEGNVVATQAGTSQAQIAAFIAALDAYLAGPVHAAFDPVTDAAASSNLQITVAYIETKFGNCTFTPTDHYELQPLKVFPYLVDYSGEACVVRSGPNADYDWTWKGFSCTLVQLGLQAQGTGETVVRELILDTRYHQNAFPDNKYVDSLRMREIETDPAIKNFDRNTLWDSINILHSVPRFNNPTGTFDNDQYLLTLFIPKGTNAINFLNTLQNILNCAGNGVVIESTNADPCSNLTPGVPFVNNCVTTPTTTAAPTTTTSTAAPTTTTSTAAPLG